MPGQHDDCRAEPQPPGARAEPGQQVEGRGDLPITGEVVFDDKAAVKPQRLGLDIVFDEITKPLATVELGAAAPRRGAAEEAELHCSGFLPAINPPDTTRCRAMFQIPSFDRRHNEWAWRRGGAHPLPPLCGMGERK